MDVQHVADAIVHIAGLPTDVQVLEMNIMCVRESISLFAQLMNHLFLHSFIVRMYFPTLYLIACRLSLQGY
jgi:spore maturation protein SpmB